MSGRPSNCLILALAAAGLAAPAAAQQSSRTTQITYYDHTGLWVLSQVSSRVVNGAVAESATFDSSSASKLTQSEFGKLQASFAYNADGTLARSADAAGNATLYGSWKRGVPQLLTHPDGTTQSAVVNDQGWIAQVTDENGSKTAYGYDSMGRVSSITPPGGDSVNWNPTAQSFAPVGGVEYGIPAGHWRQVVTTGNAVKITYFDALWRPVLAWSYDAARVADTQSFQRYSYDSAGRVVFASYPSSNASAVSGIWTEYDALGRVTASSQDSEQGVLITTTYYGSDVTGPYTTVVAPGNIQTRTWYQVFSSPSFETPIRIQRADGSLTTIARDIFGKTTSIAR